MAKQLNVNLAMTADTSKAKAELQSLQKQLNDLMLSAQKNDSSLGLSKDIQKATQMAAQLKVQLEAATGSTGKLDLTKFNDQLRKSKTSIQDYQKALTSLGPAGTQAFSNLASSIMQAEVPLRRANKALDEFATSLANTARWQLSSSILHGFMGAIQGAYRYAQDLNESLNNIRIVTGNSTEQMSKFALEANKAAKALSTTTTSYTDAALIYYQQGLSEKEVKARTDATIKMANVSRQSAEEVSSQMTAIWNNFAKGGEDLEYYADVITKLGAATASSSDEIAQGLQKFASVADTVGLSYEKATAALATVVAETRQSADVVGTAFKTMFARFQGLQLGETLEDGVGLNKYSAALATVGVQILDANGELKKMDTILDDVAVRWNSISEAQKVALAETVAGTRQYAQFMAIMNNYDKILENQKLGASSKGTLNQQAEIYAESWEAAQKRVKAAAQGIYDSLISDDFFITMLNGFEKALGAVDNFIKGIGGLGPTLSLIGNIVLEVFGNKINSALRQTITNIQSMTVSGRKAAEDLRESTLQSMLSTVTNPNTKEGVATESAIKQQAKLQQALYDKASQISVEQQKQIQNLLDINKQLGQEAIQLGKIADLEKRNSDNTKRNLLSSIVGKQNNINFADYNGVKNNLNSLQNEFMNLAKARDAFSQAMIKNDINTPEGLIKFKDEDLPGILKTLDLIDHEIAEDFKKSFELAGNDVEKLAHLFDGLDLTISESALIDTSKLREALQKFIPDENQLNEALQKVTNQFRKQAEAAVNHAASMRNAKQSTEELENFIKKLPSNFDLVTQSITRLSSIFMSLNTAIQAIKNLGSIWNNDDLSTGEKLFQTMSAFSMIIPVVTTLLNKQTLQLGAQLAMKWANITAEETHAVAMGITAIATGKAAASNVAYLASLGPIALILIAIGAAIGGVVLAYNAIKKAQEEAFKNSPEGKLKAAKERAEELSTALNEASEKATQLKDAFDKYSAVQDKLASCTKDTTEWKNALSEAKKQTEELLKLYPELFTMANAINSDGTLNTSVLESYMNIQTNKENALKQASYYNNAQIASYNAQSLQQGSVDTILEGIRSSLFTNNELQTLTRNGILSENELESINTYGTYDSNTLQNVIEKVGNYYRENDVQKYNKYFADTLEIYNRNTTEYNNAVEEAANALHAANQKVVSEVLGENSSEFERYKAGQEAGNIFNETKEFWQDKGYNLKDIEDENLIDLGKAYFSAIGSKNYGISDTDSKAGTVTFRNGNVISVQDMIDTVAAVENTKAIDAASKIAKDTLKAYSEEEQFIINTLAANANNNGGQLNLTDYFANNFSKEQINSSIPETLYSILTDIFNMSFKDIKNSWGQAKNGINNLPSGSNIEQITSADALIEQAKEINEIIGKGLKLGDTITSEQGDKLEAAGIQIGDYFATMADGTLKLVGDAEAFAAAARGVIISGYQGKQTEMDNARTKLGGWDLKQFSDQYSGNEIYDKAMTGDIEAIQEMFKILDEQYTNLGDQALYATATLEEYDNVVKNTTTSEQARTDQLNLLMPAQIDNAKSLKDLQELLDKYNYDSDYAVKKKKELADASIQETNSLKDLANVLNEIYMKGASYDESALGQKIYELSDSALSSAKSLAEFDEALNLATKYGIEFTQQQLSEYLIKLGEQFDNCATQILNYKNALQSGNAETIATTKDELRAAIAVNDLSKKYSLNSKTVDAHARMIKKQADELSKGNKELKMSAEQAVELAVRNERMNAGVKKLNENFGDLEKTLKNSKKTSMDYANAFYQIEDAISDLIGAADDFELPEGFLDIPENLDLIRQAAEGSQHAINQLGISITTSNLESVFETIRDQFGQTDQIIEQFKTQLMSIPKAIQDNLEALENGEKLSDIMGDDLNKGIEALNKFIIAAGYTREQVNAMLSGIGAKADIKMITVQQDTEVPEYETRIEPLTTGATGSQIASDFGASGRTAGKFSNLAAAMATPLPLTQGFKSYTVQTGVRKVKGYTQVPQIAINGKAGPPSLSFVGVGGGGTAGGVSNTSLGGGTKTGGGGGGSSPTRSVKPYAQSSSDPYQGIEKQIDRLSSQYNKLERARNRAYGEGALSIIRQEIEKTKELANAQRDYIKAIAGNQGLNFAKIIEQGGDLGAAIKAAGGGGGQLGKAYQALLHGEKGAINITSKDANGNEITITKDSSGIDMDIQISANGIIENYADIEDSILKKYNAEVKWWNDLSGDEQQLQENIDRMAIAEQEKDIALDQLSTTQNQLDVLWDQSDKLAEIRDGLYDLNYSLLSEKIHLKVDIAERQLKFLQYQIKILGDNIYKIPEAMNKLFGGGDTVYGKLQNLANTWKDAFYEAQSLYGLDPEQGGISAADYADMIKQAQDGLYNVIDQLLDMNEQMRNYYQKALQGVLNEMQAITSQMEHQVSIVSHLRNILSLLGRETDWTAMTGLIQGQMSMQHRNYQVSRAQAEMLKGEVQHAYANLASLQASGASEDAQYEFRKAVLEPAIQAAVQAEEKMYSDLEAFIQSINDLFKVFLDKAVSDYNKSIVGLYGTFDYLNDSLSRSSAIADEFLTTTNKLYETNELMRKLAQDMDKTDSAYAKRKLKNFSDEIQQLQNRKQLQKSDLELAKARYDLLLAEIALTEAQNAKSTVRLQRDNEGNYGYVYTADRDAIENAEADFAQKQNDLYNIALEQTNTALQALNQLEIDYSNASRQLIEDRANGIIQTDEELYFKQQELLQQYHDKRDALVHTANTAIQVLNEVAAEGSTEAWTTHYDTLMNAANDSHGHLEDLINSMNESLHWLDGERAAITAEAQLDTQGMINTVQQLDAENAKLANDMISNVIPKAQALLSTVNDLTAAWAAQYDQIMALIQEYMDLIAVMQQALEQLAAGDNTANNQSNLSYDPNTDYSLLMANYLKEDSSRTQQDEEYLRLAALRQAKITGENLSKDFYKLENSEIDPYIKEYVDNDLTGWIYYEVEKLRAEAKKIPGLATGGYTGEWGSGGKLALLHQKELVLNEADTENILASVKIIRQIADAIGLRAAAANTESSISPRFISNQGALEQSVTIHAEFPNATNHSEIEEAFTNLINRATQYAGRISASTISE